MRVSARPISLLALAAVLAAQTVLAAQLDGTLKLGTISKDETAGDLSAVQETYNIHDGFAVSQVLLDGKLGARSYFTLNLEDINQDSRKGLFTLRLPNFRLSARHVQNNQLFDANGAVVSERKDWRFDAGATPSRWLRLTGGLDVQNRTGERMSYPAGTASALGNGYDYTLTTFRTEAEAHRNGRGFAVGIEGSKLSDDLMSAADRSGHVFSARVFGSDPFLPFDVSHYARVAFGKQKFEDSGLDYKLATFQYVGTVKPDRRFHVRYKLYLSRIDDASTDLKTDYVRNDLDLTIRHRYGSVFGGVGYVTNDDDQTLTSYDVWRLGTAIRYKDAVHGKVSYASSQKTADEDLTLLKDVEDSRFRASLESRPQENLTVGASYADRTREFPVIDVKSQGRTINSFARCTVPGWGSVSADFSWSDQQYDDRVAGFDADSRVVTGRVDFDRIRDLRLSAGLTYLDIGKDLDIEKSILMFEGRYDLLDDYFVEVKYNVYNYDDYILLDRYYTANVVWVNFGYRLSLD